MPRMVEDKWWTKLMTDLAGLDHLYSKLSEIDRKTVDEKLGVVKDLRDLLSEFKRNPPEKLVNRPPGVDPERTKDYEKTLFVDHAYEHLTTEDTRTARAIHPDHAANLNLPPETTLTRVAPLPDEEADTPSPPIPPDPESKPGPIEHL